MTHANLKIKNPKEMLYQYTNLYKQQAVKENDLRIKIGKSENEISKSS